MKFVRIPAGEFEMGSNDGDDDERPVHRVRITRPFLFGQTEVTQKQWAFVMKNKPWRTRYGKDGTNVAASYVSWDDAVEFCRKLTDIERQAGNLAAGRVYRLPTEAEWEYACRAGTKTRWSFGEDERRMGEHEWFSDNAESFDAHEVAVKKSNPWNLHDMHGNVAEWCGDSKRRYSNRSEIDPTGPAHQYRVIRGGDWDSDPVSSRSAIRFSSDTTERSLGLGFRVLAELD